MKTFYRTKKAAKLLGVSPATLASWRKKGIGPAWIRPGGWACLYEEQELFVFKAAHPVGEP